MGYPYDPGSSFIREPGYYVHDAFGHDGTADAGIRTPCFRKIPHTGIDISPKKRGDTTAPVVSPVNGTIIETGTDPEAGLYHLIRADDGLVWGLGHHSSFERRSGRVARGDTIARMGASGGAAGVHTHIWAAPNLAAARNIITGYVNYRKGRTVAAWAQSMGGLIDPYPLIVAEWAAEERAIAERARQEAAEAAREAAAVAAAREDDDMKVVHNTQTGHVYQIGVQYLRHETYGPAAASTAALLTTEGKVIDLSAEDFKRTLNAYGIPLAAETAVLRGKLWSPTTGVIDARTLNLDATG